MASSIANVNMLSNNERNFFEALLERNIRADGRNKTEARKVNVEFRRTTKSLKQCNSHCQVSFGETKALAVVSCEVVEPYPDRQTEGILSISTTLSPMASQHFEFGKQSNSPQAIKVGSAIEQAIRESKALDVEALCIVAGSKVWSIRCDVHILNHCGNLVDAGCLAALGALAHFRRPEVSVVGDVVTIYELDEREPVPLSIHHLPLCVSFGLYRTKSPSNSDSPKKPQVYVITDPTDREEEIMNGMLTVVVNPHGEICSLIKQGWPPLSIDDLDFCISIATEKSKEWAALIKS